jgi:hypothetical protein
MADVNVAVSTSHDKDWYYMPMQALLPINGPTFSHLWCLNLPTDDVWNDYCNKSQSISRLDVLLQMFLIKALNTCVTETN